jgi:hypothetical protein
MPHLLLDDVFTFLTFLHVNDIVPRGTRRLPPNALVRLDQQLALPDRLKLSSLSGRGGKHGPIELETDRIRFIHFLCEASSLVALTGHWLKPTPRAAHWLKALPHERVAQLFDAAFPSRPDRALDQLWRIYRLPASPSPSPTLGLAPILDILRQMRREDPLKLTTLLKLARWDELPLHELLRYLAWFDAIEWRAIQWHGRSAFELTDQGARLLHRPDAPPAPPVAVPLPLKLTRTGKLMVPPDADWLTLYDVSQYAQLVSPQPRRIYQLDRDLVQRAIRRGEPLTRLVHLLEAATRRTLPGPIAQSLDAWAREVSRLSLRRVTLLETRDPSLLAQLSSERRTRQHIQRTLSPRAVVLREDRLPALVRRLERQGLAPRVEFQLPSPLGRRAGDEGSTRRKFDRQKFDAPTAAHLYLAVRLNHQMSEVLPSACRTPYSILLDLEKQLSPRDRDLAAQLADEAAERILHPPHSPLPLFLAGEGPGVGAASTAETITSLQRAIEAGTPLTIVYYSPYRDEVTTRTIEPHRIEWHGKTPYLTSALRAGASVAYCQLDSDERTFRVDRIRSVVSG